MRRNKSLGIYKKLKQARKKYKSVLKNDVIFELHANTEEKISRAIEYLKDNNPIVFDKMVLEEFE